MVPGKYMSKSLKNRTAATIQWQAIKHRVNGEEVRVNGAKVVKSDIVGPNGVIPRGGYCFNSLKKNGLCTRACT